MLYVLLTASNLIFLICGYHFGLHSKSDKLAVSATLSNIKNVIHGDEEATVPVEEGDVVV